MKKHNLKLYMIGIITGFINGLFGSGGGTIIVPTLVFILRLKDYKAHATAISIILPLTIISTIIYLINNIIPYDMMFQVLIGGLIGSYIGAKFLKKIPTKVLRKVFGTVILYTAIRMIWM